MRELSLHLLDLIENAIAAGATVISVTVRRDPQAGLLTMCVEDNGPGLNVPADVATDPFYTTKTKKRGGLGLALLRETAERAGGRLEIGRSPLGGAAVSATVQIDHIDRPPMGDLASTLMGVVCTNPGIGWQLTLDDGQHRRQVDTAAMQSGTADGMELARRVAEILKKPAENLIF